jgi:hypothetical protein
MFNVRFLAVLAIVGLASIGSGFAAAADPIRGYELYGFDESGGPCISCHGNPKDNRLRVLNGANNPAAIRGAAIKLRVPVPPQDILDDLAAYLGTYIVGPVVAAPAEPVLVVEYFHADFDHYFVTILPAEITALDSGAQTGWKRTGKRFYAWKSVSDAPAAATPVCRFYIPPDQGNSHFYSASPMDCATVASKFPSFVRESNEVMYLFLPDAATGACSGLTAPVYRLWNDPGSRGRTDNNHRFTTDTTSWAQMVAAGSVPEGYGAKGVGMCAPIPSLPF